MTSLDVLCKDHVVIQKRRDAYEGAHKTQKPWFCWSLMIYGNSTFLFYCLLRHHNSYSRCRGNITGASMPHMAHLCRHQETRGFTGTNGLGFRCLFMGKPLAPDKKKRKKTHRAIVAALLSHLQSLHHAQIHAQFHHGSRQAVDKIFPNWKTLQEPITLSAPNGKQVTAV